MRSKLDADDRTERPEDESVDQVESQDMWEEPHEDAVREEPLHEGR